MSFKRVLPIIEFEQNYVSEKIDPNEDLRIIDEDIVNECAEQPAKYAFYATMYSDVLVELESKKSELNVYEAETEQMMRLRIAHRYGEKEKITEAKLAAEFARDEKWNIIHNEIMLTKLKCGRLEGIKEAFKQRSQQLYNIASVMKQEAKNTPYFPEE